MMPTDSEQALKEILDYYGSLSERDSQETIVAMLRELQDVYGFLSLELLQMAAEAAGVKLSVITCIMKLYKSLKPAPYRHQVTVCTGPRCAKADDRVLQAVKEVLGIKGTVALSGTLSSDQSVLLETKNCLKHCKTAPNMTVDGVLYPHMTAEEAKKLLKRLLE